jgi:hypothetical protein
MAYGHVKLEALGDVGGEYEDPDKLARSGEVEELCLEYMSRLLMNSLFNID